MYLFSHNTEGQKTIRKRENMYAKWNPSWNFQGCTNPDKHLYNNLVYQQIKRMNSMER